MIKNSILSALIISITASLACATASSAPTSMPSTKTEQAQDIKLERILWGVKVSPYVRKAFVTLKEKNIPFTLKEILPGVLLDATKQPTPDAFKTVSPFGKIPAFEELKTEGDKQSVFSITDSAVIMNYLEATVKTNPLRPQSAQENAHVDWWIKYGDDTIAPLTHKILFENVINGQILKNPIDKAAVQKVLTEDLPKALDFLEKELSDNRSWIAKTDAFSLADITVVSHLLTVKAAGEDLDKVIGANRPNVKKYVDSIINRPSFKEVMS